MKGKDDKNRYFLMRIVIFKFCKKGVDKNCDDVLILMIRIVMLINDLNENNNEGENDNNTFPAELRVSNISP